MILGQMSKGVAVLAQATVDVTVTGSTYADMTGCGAVTIEAIHPPAAATNSSAKWQVLDVLVGDTTDFSSATIVSGLSGTTNSTASTSQFVLGVHNSTSYGSITRLSINQLRHPYVFVRHKTANATNYNVPAFIFHGFAKAEAPSSASEAGCAAIASAPDNA